MATTSAAPTYMYGKVFTANNEPEKGYPNDPMYHYTLHFHRDGSYYEDKNGIEKMVNEKFDPKTRYWQGQHFFPKDQVNSVDGEDIGYQISVKFDPTYEYSTWSNYKDMFPHGKYYNGISGNKFFTANTYKPVAEDKVEFTMML